MHIKIYSTATCGYCHKLKAYLDEHEVAYEDVRVDTDQDAAREMVTLSGQMGVPFTVVTKDDGQQVSVLGFDQQSFRELLNI